MFVLIAFACSVVKNLKLVPFLSRSKIEILSFLMNSEDDLITVIPSDKIAPSGTTVSALIGNSFFTSSPLSF